MPVLFKILGFIAIVAGMTVLGYVDGQAVLGTVLTIGGLASFVVGRMAQAG